MNRSIGILLVALVAFMSFVGAAVANDDVEEPESAITTPMIVVDEDAGTITIALPVDGTLPEDCLPEDDGDDGDPAEPAADEGEGVDEGDEEEPESYGPGDCIELILDHPSGKTHHGAVVSTVAKSLHPSMLDGMKKGEIMRWVAKGGGDDDGDEGEVEPREKPEKPEKREKPDKSDKPGNKDNPGKKDNPGNGNGNGNGRDNPGKGKGPKS